MKRQTKWMLVAILLCGISMLTSCSKEDNFIEPEHYQQPLVLTGDAAVEWTKAHLDSLVNVYLADCGNLLDPDLTRDMLDVIGYNRLNFRDYSAASWLIDSVVYIRLMDRAIEAGNKTIVFTMGMYGCGKTTSLSNNPDIKEKADRAGVVYEGANSDLIYFDQKVVQCSEKGFTPSVIYVYNDAETGFTNCMERLIQSNRAVTCKSYIRFFPAFQGRVEYLEEHYPEMELYCLDNNHNNGGVLVSHEDAKAWDYTMDEDLQKRLYDINQSYITSGRLTNEQIQALQPSERL